MAGRGAASSTQTECGVSLVIIITNDGTGDEKASYTVRVAIGGDEDGLRTIATGRVHGHMRSDGWRALARRAVDSAAVDSAEGLGSLLITGGGKDDI